MNIILGNKEVSIKKAFTLAEVLITLGIIGIVIAMTLPSLVARYKEKETVAKLKKVNNILAQALQQAIEKQGATVDSWPLEGEDSKNGAQFLVDNYFKPYVKILNNCPDPNVCIGSKKYKYLNGIEHIAYNTQNRYRHLILADGTLVIFHVSPEFLQCSNIPKNCAEIFIDVDGYFKGPNQFGRDFFVFSLLKDRIVPYGVLRPKPQPNYYCNVNGSGLGCAEFIIRYEKMEYLN